MNWSNIKKSVLDTILGRKEINEEVQPNRIRYLRRNTVTDRPTSTYNRIEQPIIHSNPNIPYIPNLNMPYIPYVPPISNPVPSVQPISNPNIPSAPPLYNDNDLPSYTEAVDNYEQPPPKYNDLF
ncbi:hypothetical protein NEIRO03_2295 [Nematocida sp. AWRm78]|nr:hypothetical protein NEIRO03_2295 [Nematocida sp. AWRm78]